MIDQPFSESSGLLDRPDSLRTEAGEQGYLYLSRLIEPETVLSLRARALESCARLGWLAESAPIEQGIARSGIRLGIYDDPNWVAFQCEILALPEFIALGEHPAVLRVTETLFGEPPMTRRGDICRVMSPNTPELTTVAHQDRFYVKGVANIWTAWVPLGDCPRDLGGLQVLPGSNRWGLQEHHGEGSGRQGVAESDEWVWASGDFRCGDVLLFNCLTLHRAGVNLTKDTIRISADYRFQPASQPL